MPGFATHYLFGIKNLKQLRQNPDCWMLLQSIDRHKTVFQLGLQGPDIFFYHLPSHLKRINPGSIIHTRWTGDFLKYLIKSPELFWETNDQQTAQAYAAGFLGHYMLDAQIHPYVYCLTGAGELLKKKGYADHLALETDIDACLLMYYERRLPSEFAYGKTIAFDAHARSVTASILCYAFRTVFPDLPITKRYFSDAVRSMQIGTRLTYNPHNYKRQLLGAAERLLFGRPAVSPVIPTDHLQVHPDPLNLKCRQWHNPWNPKAVSNSSVLEMINKASRQYQKAFKQLSDLYKTEPYDDHYDFLLAELAQFLGEKSFHSGQDWMLGE